MSPLRVSTEAPRTARATRAAWIALLVAPLAASSADAAPDAGEETASGPEHDAWGPLESLDDRLLLTREPSRARLGARPPDGPRSRCGARRAACVHGPTGGDEASLERTLEVAEAALAALDALRLPAPLGDGARGGGPELDVYLDASLDRAEAFAEPGLWGTRWDRSPAFVRAPIPERVGCAAPFGLTRAVVEASLLGLDAAVDPSILDAWATHVALLLRPCAEVELAAIDEAQRAPERSLLESPAAFLYPRHLEERWGSGRPGELAFALVAISGQRSLATRALIDEPDAFDALRVSLRGQGASLPATALDLAVARAFLGSRSDDAHLVDVARYGDLGRPRHEWAVDYAGLPRRLLPARPVAPLGATYVWVDLSSAPLDSELTVVAEWEQPVAFRWALVEIDAGGAARARSDVIPVFGEVRIEKTLRNLGGAGGVLVVGLNDGEVRRDAPLDPSRDPGPPKGYQLTLYK